jgi:hypothetical protein
MRCSLELKLRGERNVSAGSGRPQQKQPSLARQCPQKTRARPPQQRPHLLRSQHVPQLLIQRHLAGYSPE